MDCLGKRKPIERKVFYDTTDSSRMYLRMEENPETQRYCKTFNRTNDITTTKRKKATLGLIIAIITKSFDFYTHFFY